MGGGDGHGARRHPRHRSPALRGWLVQAAAVATPVAAAAVLAEALPSAVCWPLAGIVTVLGYLGVMGLSHALATTLPGGRPVRGGHP